jgi:GMP synthase (glutamine-hydrolysing)
VPGGRANGGLPTVAILVAGQTLPDIMRRRGDFERFIRTRAGASSARWATYDLRDAAPLPGPRHADAFIVTGSSSSVTERAPWMLRAEELLRDIVAARTPLLGICFGHQMIAQALGGEVRRNPFGREIGTVRLARTADDPLFAGTPRAFDVHETHVDAVTRLPAGAELLATTTRDPVAAFRVGARVHGVQFHPEMDADIIRGYVAARAPIIREEGGEPEAILAGIHDGTRGHDVLGNFVRLAAPFATTRSGGTARL